MKFVIDLNKLGSVDEALKNLEQVQERIEEYCKLLTQRLSTRGAEIARINFSNAVCTGVNDANVDFKISDDGKKGTVYADGNAVLFIEFGTGITKPDNQEERDNLISGNVVGHGEYGANAMNPHGWFYKGVKGNAPDDTTDAYRVLKDGTRVPRPGIVHTYGNEANSSMWYSKLQLENQFTEIAKEVWDEVMK